MKIDEFKSVEKRLIEAEFPENIFGDSTKITDISFFETEGLKIQTEISSFKPENANQEMRLSKASSTLTLFQKWAKEKWILGTYGYKADYRLKVQFIVCGLGSKYFTIHGAHFKSISEISAGKFSSTIHNDKVTVLRQGVPIKTGYIAEYGTHASNYCFHDIETNPVSILFADRYEVDDIIEIETWRYPILEEFLKRI
jgi:hypothetical protein